MSKVSREIQIHAPREKVWAILADIGSVQDYSPGVVKSYYTSDIKEGVGSSRHCDLLPTGTIEERIVNWHDGEQYSIEIYDWTDVAYTGVARFTLQRAGIATMVIQIMDYTPTNNWPIALEGKSLEGLVGKILEGNLLGLKHFIETGEVVTQEVFRRIKNRKESQQ